MKIAIIGGTGLLGSNLVKLYSHLNMDVQAFSRNECDNINTTLNHIINFDRMNSDLDLYFQSWKPDIIINTVAMVNLSKCEKEREECYQTNVLIAQELAFIAKRYHSYYIHISTDHYYNNMKHRHNEVDSIVLVNYYAETKREAEINVLKSYEKSLVVRTNIIGFRNTKTLSFFEWLLSSLEHKENINLFNDFYTSPIYVRKLGEILLQCYNKHLKGVYNIASSNVISKYDFGIEVANKFNLSTENVKVSSIKTLKNKDDIQRASMLGLDITKIEKILNISMPSLDETLDQLLNEYKENINNEK